jgi:hypothetical protein
MGRFARFAQATYLLGRVFRHISDHTTDQNFLEAEAVQLRRTLCALASLSEIEGQVRKLEFCSQTAVCWRLVGSSAPKTLLIKLESALLILRDSREADKIIMEDVMRETLRIGREFLSGRSKSPEKVSPFMFHLLYNVSTILMEDNQHIENIKSSEHLGILRTTMNALDARWKAGGK